MVMLLFLPGGKKEGEGIQGGLEQTLVRYECVDCIIRVGWLCY